MISLTLHGCENHLNEGFGAACSIGHLGIVQFLISKYKSLIDPYDGFNVACYNGHLKIVNLLISKFKVDWKKGLYFSAYFDNNLKIVEILTSKFDCTNEIPKYYQWPHNKKQVAALLYLKTPLSAFQKIIGFQDLTIVVESMKQAIRGSDVLLPDLLNVVAQCIII